MLRRLPIESAQPLLVLAAARLLLVLLALAAVGLLSLPYDGRALAVLGGLALPWSLALLVLARRAPDAALSPLAAAGDMVVLAAIELVVPESLGAVRAAALFLIASHAHFQGERRGLAIAAGGAALLVLCTALRGDTHLSGDVLAFYESVFAVAALATGIVVGRLRTSESASRLRARGLSRRALQAESDVRRRVAESLHQGPVQELIGLDMMLATASSALDAGDARRADELLVEARELAARNVRALRDEIVDLGPYAFGELDFAGAIEHCLPAWRRRYGFEVMLSLEQLELSPELAGDLFRIASEAVANAGRHAGAQAVSISLRRLGDQLELRVTDDGHGFGDVDPLGQAEPGHLGLASMRERAELLDGTLEIESSERGTRVLALVPLP